LHTRQQRDLAAGQVAKPRFFWPTSGLLPSAN
jgi:hypothetical protein